MLPPEKIFKAYDIRGIYPTDINEENVVAIAHALVKFFSKNQDLNSPLKIGVGRDMRISSPGLHDVIVKTFVEDGAEVIDFGVVSTPTLYFAVRKYEYDGGIQISASHNPKEYNGIKVVKNGPKGIIKVGKNNGLMEIKDLALTYESVESSHSGKVTDIDTKDILNEEIENALNITGHPTIKPFKIVADAANAMGSVYLNALFEKIPGELIRMNFDLDGSFPAHQADPLQAKNLEDLQRKVVEEKADLGIEPDGDGDRMFFVDEQGEIVIASIITALVAREFLMEVAGKNVVTDINNIYTPKEIVEEYGGKLVVSRVGHGFITEKMTETEAIFGGETSGHYYFKDTGFAESQLPVLLFVLKTMTRENKKLSELVAELKRAEESGEINFKVKNAPELIEKIKSEFPDGEIDTTDGVAINFPDWRFTLRSSNTEPLLRLNVEQLGSKLDEEKKRRIMDLINQYAVFEEGESHG